MHNIYIYYGTLFQYLSGYIISLIQWCWILYDSSFGQEGVRLLNQAIIRDQSQETLSCSSDWKQVTFIIAIQTSLQRPMNRLSTIMAMLAIFNWPLCVYTEVPIFRCWPNLLSTWSLFKGIAEEDGKRVGLRICTSLWFRTQAYCPLVSRITPQKGI